MIFYLQFSIYYKSFLNVEKMCNFIFPKIIKRYSGCKCTTLVCHRANILLKIIYYYLIIQLCLTIARNIYKLRIDRAVKKKRMIKQKLNWTGISKIIASFLMHLEQKKTCSYYIECFCRWTEKVIIHSISNIDI